MSIGYSPGMMQHRVAILNPAKMQDGEFGRRSASVEWINAGSVSANIGFNRGKTAMTAGALDVYEVIIVRMYYESGKLRGITPRSRILYDGVTYQILGATYHADKIDNIIQFNAQAIVDNP